MRINLTIPSFQAGAVSSDALVSAVRTRLPNALRGDPAHNPDGTVTVPLELADNAGIEVPLPLPGVAPVAMRTTAGESESGTGSIIPRVI